MDNSDQDLGSPRNQLARRLDFSVSAAAEMDCEKNHPPHSLLDSNSSREDHKKEDLLPPPPPSGSEEQVVKSLKPPVRSELSTPPQRPPINGFDHEPAKCRVR